MQDNPYYRVYTQPPPFPAPPPVPLTPPPVPTDTTQPLTVYGTGLTMAQFERTCPRGTTRWLMASLVTLLSILGVAAFGLAAGYVGMIESSFLGFVLLAALALAVVAGRQNAAREQRAARQAWQVYVAGAGDGLTTVWYSDRVEQFSTRRRDVLTFSHATCYTEYEDMLVLQDGAHMIALRAADLTPEQAQLVYERICTAVPPQRQFMHGRFYATRETPTPPPFSTAAPVQYERFSYPAPQKGTVGLPGSLLSWLLSASVVLASLLTALFLVTPYFLLDFFLFFAALFLPAAAVALLWTRKPRRPDVTVTLTFTGEGLLIEREGVAQFVEAADVHARRTDNGATLFTPAGALTFPWTATQRRQQLEWMLFGQRY